MESLPRRFSDSVTEAIGLLAPKTVGVAVSGGVDSIALASLACIWSKTKATELKAFVVDHKLRQDSLEEAQAVSKYLTEKFNIRTTIISLNRLEDYRLERPSGSNLEELARIARRNSLYKACEAEGVTHLLMGHHKNDQIELFLQRLITGSSWFGLAGMRRLAPMKLAYRETKDSDGIQIIRPLLDVSKQNLTDWCRNNNIKWWEDPSNADIDLTKRNLIRRMYQLGAEPAAFTEDRVVELMRTFNNQRETAMTSARYAAKQLSLSGELKYDRSKGVASLLVTNELKKLPRVALGEVLFRIVAPISPLDDNKLSTRRRKLDSVAERIQTETDPLGSINILGVQISQDEPGSPLLFTREKPRQTNGAQIEIFKATPEWSDWTLIDNRWYIRWKLPDSTGNASEHGDYFSVRLVADAAAIISAISPTLPAHTLDELRKHVHTHPLFLWSDSDVSDSDLRKNLIGFPTLEPTKSLQVEVSPKSCNF